MKRLPNLEQPVAVAGPGAIGGLIAACLARSGRRVVLVSRNERWRRQLRSRGLRIEGGTFGGGWTVPAGRLRPKIRPKGPICEAVFLCVKSAATRETVRRIKPLVGPETAVVSVQNGLTHRPLIRAAFGTARTVFSISYLAAERLEPLRVRHHGGKGLILAAHPGNAAALARAQALLKASGLQADLATSEDRLLWTKAAFNAASNPIGALTGRTNGELIRIPALKDLVFRAVREAVAAARAEGHRMLYPNMDKILAQGLLLAPNQSNSMLQDIRAGRRTEVDAILKPFLLAARRRRVTTPTLDALYRFVRRLETKTAA